MAHPNEELARKGYKAFASGDLDSLKGIFAEDIVWHVPGRNQLSGNYKGRDAVFGVFAKLVDLTGGTFKPEVHDILANDEHILALVVVTGRRDGKRLEDRQVHVSHVKDGSIDEFWIHAGDQYAVDEFWG